MEKRLSLNEMTYFDIDGRFRVKLEEKVIRIFWESGLLQSEFQTNWGRQLLFLYGGDNISL